MKSTRRVRTLRNFKIWDDNVMITDDDKIRASDDKIRDDDDKMRADDSIMIAAYDKMRAVDAMMRADDAMMRVKKNQLSLTSQDEKTWLRTSTGVRYFRSGFRQRTFCNQLEVSTTSDSKVMAHYVFFMFGVILTLTFDLSRSLFMCGVNIYPLVSTNTYWTFCVAEFMWYDCTLKNKCTVRVTLTYDLWRSIIFCEFIISL